MGVEGWCLGLTLFLMALSPVLVQSLSVHLPQQTQYFLPGRSLFLKAQVQSEPTNPVYMVTWERETEMAWGEKQWIRLAVLVIGNREQRSNPRVHIHNEGQTLEVSRFESGDTGKYQVDVTASDGTIKSAHCTVREYEAIMNVSISLYEDAPCLSSPSPSPSLSVSSVPISVSLLCSVQRGTDPRFQWLQDGAPLPVGRYILCQDGRRLSAFLSPPGASPQLCGLFTCTVENELGTWAANYTVKGEKQACDRDGAGCAGCGCVGAGVQVLQTASPRQRGAGAAAKAFCWRC
ncbi:hepatic and glial cell adhesion molecule isoform X2 [Amia ocellicauda]|uniref:hepatic and glial cell adhesion molecule isoform X2 n=1 Tax=Amia ocellicauda TaxID=2972642 RepID=UPI00346476BC